MTNLLRRSADIVKEAVRSSEVIMLTLMSSLAPGVKAWGANDAVSACGKSEEIGMRVAS